MNQDSVVRTVALISSLCLCLAAFGSDERSVALTVLRNGLPVSTPSKVTLTMHGSAIRIPVVSNIFKVPRAITETDHIDFSLTMGGERISVPAIKGSLFGMTTWQLMIADSSYGEGFDAEIGPGVSIEKTCILRFDSPDAMPLFTIVEKCRQPDRSPQ